MANKKAQVPLSFPLTADIQHSQAPFTKLSQYKSADVVTGGPSSAQGTQCVHSQPPFFFPQVPKPPKGNIRLQECQEHSNNQ